MMSWVQNKNCIRKFTVTGLLLECDKKFILTSKIKLSLRFYKI